MKGVGDWIYERIPVRMETLRKPLREELPVHLKGWAFCLGGTPALLLFVLVATGILLTFYYVPNPMHAHDSIVVITDKVRFGWFVRGMHRGASHLMIIAVLLHMIRVFVTRAYRRPRELNWMVGVALFLTTLGFAFTGYSLVYDQLSYWATTVGTNMVGQAPIIGRPLLYLLRGGPDLSPNTLTRFYNFHIVMLPAIMLLLLVTHIVFVRMHGVAKLEGDRRTETYYFFPDHVLKEAIIGFLILLGLVNYVIFFPPEIGVAADPQRTPDHIRPEWYFFPSYRWLKLVPLQFGLWSSLFFVVALFLWPFIDAWFEKVAPGRQIGLILGVTAFLVTLVFLVWEGFAG